MLHGIPDKWVIRLCKRRDYGIIRPMPIEIEKKFLVVDDSWRGQVSRSERMSQGYLASSAASSVRVRIARERAWLNIKGAVIGVQRPEYEYAIPLGEAEEIMQNLCGGQFIDKTRHYIEVGSHTWELDEFHADNQGLLVAEIELSAEDECFEMPDWAGAEVSSDIRYYNSVLVEKPFNTWPESDRSCA